MSAHGFSTSDGSASTSHGVSPLADAWNAERPSRRRVLRALAAIGGGLSAGSLVYWRLSERLEITRQQVDLGLGPRHRLRAVAISDLHLDGTRESYAPLIRAIADERPDLFLVVGDTLDHRNGQGMIELVDLFRDIEAPRGKFATLGNWDHLSLRDFADLGRAFRGAGIQLLVNERVALPELEIAGVDDWLLGHPDLALVESALRARPCLVLSHCPAFMDEVGALGSGSAPYLMLSGHTHGGQFTPFGVPLWTPPGSGSYVSGLYGRAGSRLLVMRGVGYSGLPLRVGARPELAVLELV